MIKSKLSGDEVTVITPEHFTPVDFMGWLDSAPPLLGLDVESLPFGKGPSADMYDPRLRDRWLRLVQIADRDTAWVVDPSVVEQRTALLLALGDRSRLWATWSEIDVVVLHACLGVDISKRYVDGMTLSLMLEPGQLADHGLKPVCAARGVPELESVSDALHEHWASLKIKRPAKTKAAGNPFAQRRVDVYDRLFPGGWNGWRDTPVDDPLYLEYAGLDAIAVCRVMPILLSEIHVAGLSDALGTEVWVQRFTTSMRLRGVRIDLDYTSRLRDEEGGRHLAAREAFTALTGLSPASVKRAAWLSGRGVEFTKFNPSGSVALRQRHVADLLVRYTQGGGVCDDEAVEALRLLTEFSTTKNAHDFAKGLLGFVDGDGVVHPAVRPLGAVTGRWTVVQPAVQTLSRSNSARGCFIPRDGCVLVSVDQSQVEVRVAAALSGEKTLIAAFNAGDDVYNAIAATLFGDGFGKRERSIAKRVVLATLYGAGVATIVTQLHDMDGVTVDADVVSTVRQKFRRRYPAVAAFSREVNTGNPIMLPSGRIVPGDEDRAYRGINSACQGTARDVLMATLRRVDSAGFGSSVVLCVHDEIVFELPRTGLREALRSIRDCFAVTLLGVHVDCDVEVYPMRFGEDMLSPMPDGLHDAGGIREVWVPE